MKMLKKIFLIRQIIIYHFFQEKKFKTSSAYLLKYVIETIFRAKSDLPKATLFLQKLASIDPNNKKILFFILLIEYYEAALLKIQSINLENKKYTQIDQKRIKKIILPMAAWNQDNVIKSLSSLKSIFKNNISNFSVVYFTTLQDYLNNRAAFEDMKDNLILFILPNSLISLTQSDTNLKYFILSLCQSIALEYARLTQQFYTTAFSDTYYSKGFFDKLIMKYNSEFQDVIFYGSINSNNIDTSKDDIDKFNYAFYHLSNRITDNVNISNRFIRAGTSGIFRFCRDVIYFNGIHYNIGLLDLEKLNISHQRFYGPIDSDFYHLFKNEIKFTIVDFDDNLFCLTEENITYNYELAYKKKHKGLQEQLPKNLSNYQRKIAEDVFKNGFKIFPPNNFCNLNVFFLNLDFDSNEVFFGERGGAKNESSILGFKTK
ncbi:MAG: hypothetical protein WCO61_02990 [Alphaproteobacteria bacterium]